MKRSQLFFFTTTAALLLSATPLAATDNSAITNSSTASSDDDMFGDDTFVDMNGDSTEGSTTSGNTNDSTNAVSASTNTPSSASSTLKATDLAHGIIFQTGAVKVGGTFTMSASTLTTLYDDSDASFKDNVYNTTLTPKATGELTVDARPTQTLRMFTRFGMKYPYTVSAYTATTTYVFPITTTPAAPTATSLSLTSIINSFYVKELFTDFSLKDRVFFRFGLHTVTWGTGYFFSPVSDMINTSTIDPEDPTAQVNGALNLRTQITFPGTQNCLWMYVIPDTTLNTTTYAYDARKTALAAKGDILLGDWELGMGAFWKYENAPKAMLTASGSIINNKVSVFAEGVYSYGSAAEWNTSTDWDDKTNIFQATAGASYYWKTPQITFAAQYYYDSNEDDDAITTKGHNIAGTISFGKVGTTDLTANIFSIFYLQRDTDTVTVSGVSYTPSRAIISASLAYAPIDELSISAGPYITIQSFDEIPTTALKLTATLGGGKF